MPPAWPSSSATWAHQDELPTAATERIQWPLHPSPAADLSRHVVSVLPQTCSSCGFQDLTLGSAVTLVTCQSLLIFSLFPPTDL